MKFRTEIDIRPFGRKLGYDEGIFAVGSCFAERVAARLAEAKFRVTANPSGVMFNPLSVAETIERCAENRRTDAAELHEGAEGWFHYGFHGSLNRSTAAETAAAMNAATEEGHRALAGASTVILTLGTACVFRLAESGEAVANCHRQPAATFRRERLTAGQIAARLGSVIERYLGDKHIILTVSPVRHLADGLAGNMLSKSILRVAAAELEERHANVDYFPAYEIICDDLRDYRFYADDMVHPSQGAVEYVWEKFVGTALSPAARGLLPQVEAVVAASKHRPLHPDSESYRAFCRRQIEIIDSMGEVPLTAERAVFAAALAPRNQTNIA